MKFVPLAETVDKLLSRKTRWTQNSYARNKNNEKVSELDKNAVKFCLAGAIAHVYHNDTEKWYLARNKVESILIKEVNNPVVVEFNDNPETTFKDIRRIIRKAKI